MISKLISIYKEIFGLPFCKHEWELNQEIELTNADAYDLGCPHELINTCENVMIQQFYQCKKCGKVKSVFVNPNLVGG